MAIENKTKVATAGVAGLLATGLVGFLVYRYRKYKKENSYYDSVTEADIAWG